MSRKLDVVILACRQAVPDPTALANPIKETGFGARVVSEPCSSKVEVFQMLRSLASEADLLWVVGCPEEACQLVEGSFRMGKRVAYAQDYLKENHHYRRRRFRRHHQGPCCANPCASRRCDFRL